MAQGRLKYESLSYYPPRSRWHTRVLYGLARPFRRVFNLDAFQKAAPLSVGGLALAVLLPGYSFFALGRKLFGWICLGCFVVSAALFVVRLGFTSSAWCYGLMISLHATSIVYVQTRWLTETGFVKRAVLALCTLFAVWALLYSPVSGYAQRHWCMPVRDQRAVWVVKPGVNARTLQRGDWVLHQIPRTLEEGVVLQGGLGIDPVLALPGDTVRFTRASVLVNGRPYPRADLMPVQGEFVVPENVWFIWSEVSIRMGARARAGGATALMQETAMVTAAQILGRPYKRWFGRNQWP